MAASTYDEALRRLLAHEGGYTDHPSDPGGPTNFGITIYDYRKYVKPNATAADVPGDEARRGKGDLPHEILGSPALRQPARRRGLQHLRLRREFWDRTQRQSSAPRRWFAGRYLRCHRPVLNAVAKRDPKAISWRSTTSASGS